MTPWSLQALFDSLPEVTRETMQPPGLHLGLFNDVLALLQRAPLIHPTAPDEFMAKARARDAQLQLQQSLPAGPERHRRLHPEGIPGSQEELHLLCLYSSGFVVLRSLARSGFLAFAGLQTESIATHRRTLEALVHLELLIDRPQLANAYWRHATETMRRDRAVNPFKSTAEGVQGAIKNPQQQSNLTPLQELLRKRAVYGDLDAGPHAGLIHAITGMGPRDTLAFFDVRHHNAGRYAFRYAWETVQLCDALLPKMPWIDARRWREDVAKLQEVAKVIEAFSKEEDGWSGVPAPWSSSQALRSQDPSGP